MGEKRLVLSSTKRNSIYPDVNIINYEDLFKYDKNTSFQFEALL